MARSCISIARSVLFCLLIVAVCGRVSSAAVIVVTADATASVQGKSALTSHDPGNGSSAVAISDDANTITDVGTALARGSAVSFARDPREWRVTADASASGSPFQADHRTPFAFGSGHATLTVSDTLHFFHTGNYTFGVEVDGLLTASGGSQASIDILLHHPSGLGGSDLLKLSATTPDTLENKVYLFTMIVNGGGATPEFSLDVTVDAKANASAATLGVGAGGGSARADFGSTITWTGLISATDLDGQPIPTEGLHLFGDDGVTDYAVAPPADVPEPALSFTMLAALLPLRARRRATCAQGAASPE